MKKKTRSQCRSTGMTSLGHSDYIHNPVIPALVHFLKVSFQHVTLESSEKRVDPSVGALG
ncbi:hypothetical protein [Wolbachia endosymbiont of Ctenocephalides felis wCfeJ]|uniref:hypothetical protein n=1 Tax=Wolbachia endosymbiont of Ctenocephalides felis wCfeJ TaxID=2732594 RepID=UPI0014460DDB|nr:hypothetical protein [Wolbachia endosymbiont of Ctenocephalides felis wCfeJ]